MELGEIPTYTKGKIKYIGDYFEGDNDFGHWTLQNVTISDPANPSIEMKVCLGQKPKLEARAKGHLLHILAKASDTKGWVGVKIKADRKKADVKIIDVTEAGEIFVGTDLPATSGSPEPQNTPQAKATPPATAPQTAAQPKAAAEPSKPAERPPEGEAFVFDAARFVRSTREGKKQLWKMIPSADREAAKGAIKEAEIKMFADNYAETRQEANRIANTYLVGLQGALYAREQAKVQLGYEMPDAMIQGIASTITIRLEKRELDRGMPTGVLDLKVKAKNGVAKTEAPPAPAAPPAPPAPPVEPPKREPEPDHDDLGGEGDFPF